MVAAIQPFSDGRSGSGRDPETPTRQYLISRPESATSLRTLNELSFPEGQGNRSGGHVRRTGGGGKAAGVLADSLKRSVLNRDHRNYLRDDRLVLLSPYDPQAGFNIGNAMQRNKLIYALADAALVVQSDYGKGGTWAGAIEQLDRFRLVPVYILPNDQQDAAGISREKGALTWPGPTTPEDFDEALAVRISSSDTEQLSFTTGNGNQHDEKLPIIPDQADSRSLPPDEQLFATVRTLLEQLDAPETDKEIAKELKVTIGRPGNG